jgi:hypothetical protein
MAFADPGGNPAQAPRTVSAPPSVAQQLQEQQDRLFFTLEVMLLSLSVCADTPPSAGQAHVPEEGRTNRHGVISRHVPCRVQPFDIEMIGLCNHEGRIASSDSAVQQLV